MLFDYYFVSITGKYSEELLVKLNANALLSYYQDMSSLKRLIDLKRKNIWSGKLIVDNGAYTLWKKNNGFIDIDKYIDFLNDNFDVIDYAIALDVIPGAYKKQKTAEDITEATLKTWNNYMYMRSRVCDVDKLIPVFHQDDQFEWLTKYLNIKDLSYICIAAHNMTTRNKWYAKCFSIIQDSNNPNIKVHCLGNSLIDTIKTFPFKSIDASSWKIVAANGSIFTDYGVIYVGTKTHIDNIPENIKKELQHIVELCDMKSVYELAYTYKARALYNMYYLFNQSNQKEVISRIFKKERSLF